ncbi:hypothetical protein [Marisediminicola sp. LYQ85]|uniref:hypothetical protein n=1 Tax=Marisediminicola sp. LYQ85 TaxID=3391062 RepID=UPI003982FECA
MTTPSSATAASYLPALNTDALTARTRRRDVSRFYRAFAAQHSSVKAPLGAFRRVTASVGVAAGIIGLLTMVVGITQEVEGASADMASELAAMSFIVALFVAAGVTLGWFWVRSRRQRGTPERHYRLARFAADNGLVYSPGPYAGGHITPWRDRGRLVVSRLMRSAAGRSVEFANFELAWGSATDRNTQFGGYCAIRLTTALPHIVLHADDNRHPLELRAMPTRALRLSLEGDFDTHFALYCPAGYERDALYLFTPDIMARLIDSVSGYDIEIIDDWLFLVTTRDVVTLHPATWSGLADAVDAVTEKVTRWERWRDDRRDDDLVAAAAADGVAAPPAGQSAPVAASQGRRLRFGMSKAHIATFAVVAFFCAVILVTALVE